MATLSVLRHSEWTGSTSGQVFQGMQAMAKARPQQEDKRPFVKKVMSELEFFSFVRIWAFEFYKNLDFWVLSELDFFSFVRLHFLQSFVRIWVIEFGHNLSLWVLSHLYFFSFVRIHFLKFITFWVSQFCKKLCFRFLTF